MNNVHDKFFKESFSHIEVTQSFLEHYLPEGLVSCFDLQTLSIQKDSFINKRLKESYSDLLFKVNLLASSDTVSSTESKEGYIYLLFEHKSYSAPFVALQLLGYMVEIWDAMIKKQNMTSLPLIMPIVVHHGDRFKASSRLDALIFGYDTMAERLKNYVPNFHFVLYDVSMMTNVHTKGEVRLRIVLSMFQAMCGTNSGNMIETVTLGLQALQELEDKDTALSYLETYMRYVFSAVKEFSRQDVDQILNLVECQFPEGSEVVMTIADYLRAEGRKKGREEGIAQGLEKGLERGVLLTVKRLLTKKFGDLPEALIITIESLSTEQLENIVEGIFEIETIDQLMSQIL